jgi:hypothetical protein
VDEVCPLPPQIHFPTSSTLYLALASVWIQLLEDVLLEFGKKEESEIGILIPLLSLMGYYKLTASL